MKVSVCILNWNNLSVVKRTILRLKNEEKLFELFQIIIFDQNSSDGSIEFLKSVENIECIFSKNNVGNSISRNIMIEKAKGDFIVFLDGDILPIKNSIYEMAKVLIKNQHIDCVSYTHSNYSDDEREVKEEETEILPSNMMPYRMVKYGEDIAPTHYGMYRREVFDKIRFPEFYPFNFQGWGAEDNIVGVSMYNSGFTIFAITNSTFYHEIHSSWKCLQKDLDGFKRNVFIRRKYYLFFKYLLTKEQQIESLTKKEIPSKINININPYYYKTGTNLGDMCFGYIIDRYYNFLNFNRNSSNIGCFGGSVIDHPALVPEIYNNAKNVILFGTGIMSQENLLFNRRISYEIYPRGYETEKCLKELCIESYGVVGDTAFLLSIEPKIKNSFKNIVGILDAYKKNDLPIKCDSYIAVAKTERTNGYKVYCDLKEYIKLLHNVSVIVSSQIHPSIIAGALGVSAIMIKKDIRFNDIIGVINPRYSVDKEIYFFTEKDREKMYDICSYSWQTNFFKMLSKYVVRE